LEDNMKNFLTVLLCLGLLAGVAGTQAANPGDYLLASSTGGSVLYVVAPYSNTFSTLATFPGSIRGVVVGSDNTDYFVASGLELFRVTPLGVVTTVVTSLTPGTGTAWCDLDEDGQILVGTGWANGGGVFRVHPAMGTYTTLLAGGISANGFCLDRDTGDVIVGDTNGKRVYRVNRLGTVTTVVNSISTVYAMDFHPLTGDALIAISGTIYRLDATNTLSTFASGTGLAKSLAVLANGDVLAGPHGTVINLYDRNGRKIGTTYNGSTLAKMALAVEDENNVWGLNAPVPGGVFNISIRFALHPNKPYVAAASFSRSPGIPVDNRIIPLTPDNLFGASVTLPVIFNGFVGILDRGGRGSAYIAIPKVAGIRGIRLFLAAVVIDGAAPSSIAQISQAYGVTIQ
jgi:hypothetical protein